MFRSTFAPHDPRREMLAKAYGRPSGGDQQDRAIYLEFMVEFKRNDQASRLRTAWFTDAVDFYFRDVLDKLVADGPSGRALRHRGVPMGPPGSMWGHTRTEIRGVDGRVHTSRRVVSAGALGALAERLAEPGLEYAALEVGRVGKSGFWAGSPQFSVLTQNVVLPEGRWLRFGLMFGDDLLYTLDGTMQTTALAESFGDLCDPAFGIVDYSYRRTRYEEEHGLVDYDNFSLMRSRLRGFGWLTIIPKQIASAIGGHDALVHPTFARVTELKCGGYLLQATHQFNKYGDDARARLAQFFAPYLVDTVKLDRAEG